MSLKITLVALTLILVASAIPAAGQAVRFAVTPCEFTGDAKTTEWLGTGVAFDVEKRLERWSGFQSADRLKVRGALRSAAGLNEHAIAKALFDRLELDVAVTLTGSFSEGELELRARVWTGVSTSVPAIRVNGALSELFLLQDRLLDALAPALRSACPKLQAPDRPDRMRIAPAKSVEAYEFVIRGMTASQNGSLPAARSSLTKALELEPGLWWAHYFLGAVEFHEGKFDRAIGQCKAAIALDPGLYAGVYANLAYCYNGLGDTDGFRLAKDEFERRSGRSLPQRALPVAGFTRRTGD